MSDLHTEQQQGTDAARLVNSKVLPVWFINYTKTNKDFPMAPAATDTFVGRSVVESIVQGKSSLNDFIGSEFDSKQINALVLVVTDAHRRAGVSVVPEAKALKTEQSFPVDRFHVGWANIKGRVLKAVSTYISNLHTDLNPDPDDVFGEQNVGQLNTFFTDAKYQKQLDALVDLYAAASAPLGTEKYIAGGLAQQSIYAGHTEGFRVTAPLMEIISEVDMSVTSEWEKRYKSVVPEEAKNSFVDVITRRKDQPVN